MADQALRLVFAGTPDFAAIHLQALIDSRHQLLAAYTQPDRRAGRGRKLQASPVKQLAQAADIPVCQPATLRDIAEQESLAALAPDLLVVVAYGLILPQAVLDLPRYGCLNVHASLLPRWRGAAPIQRAIEAGDAETGITIMQMDAGLDTGDMLATRRVPIGGDTTAASLHDALAVEGAPLLLQVLDDLPGCQRRARKQDDSQATYAGKILKEEAVLDWSQSAADLDLAIRAFNPFPVCYSSLDGERIRIWEAKPAGSAQLPEPPGTILRAGREGVLVNCGQGQLSLQRVQLPGARALTVEEVLNAHREQFAPGRRFLAAATQG
jgi:methionyl-tRNA formyltransferase